MHLVHPTRSAPPGAPVPALRALHHTSSGSPLFELCWFGHLGRRPLRRDSTRQDRRRGLEPLAGAETKRGLQQALGDDLRLLVVLEPEAASHIVEYRDIGGETAVQPPGHL